MRVKHSRFLLLGLLFCAVADFWTPLIAAEVSPADRQTKLGLELFQRGDFEQSALTWTEAAQLYERAGEIRRAVSVVRRQDGAVAGEPVSARRL